MNTDIYTPLDGLPGAQLRVDNLAEYIVVVWCVYASCAVRYWVALLEL